METRLNGPLWSEDVLFYGKRKFKEDLFSYCEPFVVKQDPGENSSQSPPHIDHNCCYECGDSLDGIFCQRCTCKSCGKGAHHGYNCPPKVPIISNPGPCNNQTIDELLQTLPRFDPTCYSERENSLPYVSKPNFVDDSPNVFNPPPQPPTYSYEFCGNDAYYGYDCPPQVPFIYPEPCYNQDFNFPQNFHNFQQQYLCCENCGGPHETFQCQPMNQSYYEPNPCYDSNSFSFDQFQPPQYTVNHPIFNAQNELFNSQNKLMEQLTSVCDMVGQYIQKKEEGKRIEEEQAAKARYWKIPVCYDDVDEEEISIPLKDTIISELPPCVAITPALSTEEPVDSLIMENEHLDTIPETESDEFIKSSVENLVQNPSESEDFSDIESECDMPVCTLFLILTRKSFLVSLIRFIMKTSILRRKPKDVRFDAESYLLESLVNRDTLMASPPKIDFLLDEFASELTHFHAIPNTIIKSLPIFSIPVEDSDSLREEIDIFPGPDDSIPPGIESDDFDSEDDNNSTSLPEFDSFHVDYPDSGDSTINVVEDIPVDVPNILPTHPALQLDFDFIPSNDLGYDLDVSSPSGDRNKIYDPGICIEVESTRFLAPLSPVIDTLLPFSSENEDKVFNHGVLAYKEKSPPSSSHRGLKAFQLSPESPMMIHGDNTPNLGVRHPHFYPP
ncbi:hypothetical protein Tco_1114400 [Tanacetum coccineum]|uniref:Uncharacterized protein n=1 Tax=Tanacetum coccineum TaxID=301880 RepID=A0ABQ5IUY8_9ASTR